MIAIICSPHRFAADGQIGHRILARCALLLVMASPTLLHSQFQAPTDEELKMTADPKAPGADAVYLYREEIDDNDNHTIDLYERIKVLAEKGKEMATVRLPYELGSVKVTDIQGRTIHVDGSVIPLTAKPDDLMDVKTKGYQRDMIVFTLPSAEVGSILEYRLKIRTPFGMFPEPTWEIQQPYFVHRAHYYFQPNSHTSYRNLMCYTRIESGATVTRDKKGFYTLDVVDVPPLPDEDWMPPLNTIQWRVTFYYTDFESSEAFWKFALANWAKWVDEFDNPTGGIKKIAGDLVAPGDTEEQKARKIYDAVMKLENTEFTRRKSAAERKSQKLKPVKKAEDVWKQKSGSSDEIALLYVALARAAGLKVVPMQVVNRDRAIFDGAYLYSGQLDDFIAIVTIGGKDIYVDPGEKICPFGRMHWKHMLTSGFKLSGTEAVLAVTPGDNFKSTMTQRNADLEIDEQGQVTGSVRFVMTGLDALHWRQLALENDEDEVRKQFNESIRGSLPDGVQADFDHFLALDDCNVNLIGIVKLTGGLGTATGKRLFVPGLFFESNAKHPFVALDKRTTPIDVRYARMEQDDVTYHLPAGFQVESAPQLTDTGWPEHAELKIASGVKGSSVRVVRSLGYTYILLGPKDYPALHDFYQKVATADQQPLVLVRTQTAKGN